MPEMIKTGGNRDSEQEETEGTEGFFSRAQTLFGNASACRAVLSRRSFSEDGSLVRRRVFETQFRFSFRAFPHFENSDLFRKFGFVSDFVLRISDFSTPWRRLSAPRNSRRRLFATFQQLRRPNLLRPSCERRCHTAPTECFNLLK